jgi:hypothetical protein
MMREETTMSETVTRAEAEDLLFEEADLLEPLRRLHS